MARQRFWTIRVVQEYVTLADSADEVIEAMEVLQRREAEGMSLVGHGGYAAPTVPTGDPTVESPPPVAPSP